MALELRRICDQSRVTGPPYEDTPAPHELLEALQTIQPIPGDADLVVDTRLSDYRTKLDIVRQADARGEPYPLPIEYGD